MRRINWTVRASAIFFLLTSTPSLAERAQSVLQSGAMFRDCENCPEMVVIPAGSFQMGSADGEWTDDLESMNVLERWLAEKARAESHPQHRVTVDRMFALGKYHVTRGEFATFAGETGHVVQSGCTTLPRYRGDGRLAACRTYAHRRLMLES